MAPPNPTERFPLYPCTPSGGLEVHAKRMRKLFVMHNVVAIASARLERFAVEDHDTTASVPDQALCLHSLRQQRHGRPAGTQHLCQKFLSQRDLVAADAVSALQQPPT